MHASRNELITFCSAIRSQSVGFECRGSEVSSPLLRMISSISSAVDLSLVDVKWCTKFRSSTDVIEALCNKSTCSTLLFNVAEEISPSSEESVV